MDLKSSLFTIKKKMKKNLFIIAILSLFIILLSCKKKDDSGPSGSTSNGDTAKTTNNFFPKGIYAVNIQDFAAVKAMGFNIVQSYQFKTFTNAQKKAYLDAAQANGLYVMYHIDNALINDGSAASIQNVKDQISLFKNHPALYCWYLYDEPYIKKMQPAVLKAFYDAIKQIDPVHEIYVSNWEFSNFYESTDVDMRQLYDGRASAMKRVLSGSYIGNINSHHRKWLAIINTHMSSWGIESEDLSKYTSPKYYFNKPGGGTYKPADPEYAVAMQRVNDLNAIRDNPFGKADSKGKLFEKAVNLPGNKETIKGQVASALAYGSKQIWWWLWKNPTSSLGTSNYYTTFDYLPTRNSIKEVIRELATFEKYLVSTTNTKDVQIRANGILLRYIKAADGKEIIIAVNETESDVSTMVALPQGAGNSYKNTAGNQSINLTTTPLILKANEGMFLVNQR